MPRNDGPNGLFPYPLKRMIADRRPIRTLTGTVKNENGWMKEGFVNATALYVAAMCNSVVTDLKLKHENKIERECVEEYISRRSDTIDVDNNDYGTNATGKNPYSYWTERTVELYEDVRYFAPNHKEVASLVSNGATVYLYSFDYEKTGEEGITPFHSFDLAYLVGLHIFDFDERDKKIQSLYLPLFINFTKYGNPTIVPLEGVRWAPVSSDPVGFNYLSVDIPLRMKPNYHKNGVIFWNYKVPIIENIHATVKSFDGANGFGSILIAIAVMLCLGLTFMGIFLYRKHRSRRAGQILVETTNVSNYDTFNNE